MRSYYFHLVLELYDASEVDLKLEKRIFFPPPDTDIFSTSLPAHSIIQWSDQLDPEKPSSRRFKTFSSSDQLKSKNSSFSPSRTPLTKSGSFGAVATASQIQEGGGASSSRPLLQSELASKDWRFDSVSIQSIDMEENRKEEASRGRGKSISHNISTGTQPTGPATRGRFVPSDPRNTEVGWGVVHLYRDLDETTSLYDDLPARSEPEGSSGNADTFNHNKCETLCILAVPSYMTPSDFLGFVGEQTRENVSHFRLIRTGRANKYMVLMKFRDAKKAQEWQKEWNGKPFNSMEPEYCNVVFVQSVTFQTTEHSKQPSSFPNMMNDPFIPDSQPITNATSSATADSPITTSLTTKPLAPPTPALVELPTCPVCLERMDETTGLLIILCQHVFHCACLEKWKGSGCPVCRYTQNGNIPGLTRSRISSVEDGENVCSVCRSESNLWICLICGNVGCGRYDSAHAFAHYEATRHSYAMDINTQHVWDYAGDGYVHRLIQNKGDGKLMDLPEAAFSNRGKGVDGGMSAFGADMVPREKMEAMGNEYAYLLTSQLDSQRLYFEEQLERAVDKASKASHVGEQAALELEGLSRQLKELKRDHDKSQGSIEKMEREMERVNKRAEKADALARKLGKDWKEEKTMNEALMERIKFLDDKVKEEEKKLEEVEAEKRDLEEQNRDLSFFISGTEKLKEAGDDVVEGKIEVPVQEEEGSGKKRKGKGKR